MVSNQKIIFVYDDFSSGSRNFHPEAMDYAKEILETVRENWEKLAAGYGLTRRQIEEMRHAFNACYE